MAGLGRHRRLRPELTDHTSPRREAPVHAAVYPHAMSKGSSGRATLLALLTIVAMAVVGVLLALDGEVFLGVVMGMVGLPLAVLVWLMAIDGTA